VAVVLGELDDGVAAGAQPDHLRADEHLHGARRRLHQLDGPEGGRRRRAGGLAVDEVGVADERGHPRRGRPGVQLGGPVGLDDAALRHHRHVVAEHERLVLVVGHEHAGDAEVGEEGVDLAPHLHPQRRVEVRERLVEQEHAGAGSERPGQRHALLLAAGQRRRQPVAEAGEPDEGEGLVDAAAAVGIALRDAVADVPLDGHVREQRPVLEHHPDVAALRRHGRDVAPADDDRAGVGPLEPGEDPQQRRLAAARRSEQGDDRAGLDREVDVVEDLGLPEPLDDPAGADAHRLHYCRTAGRGRACTTHSRFVERVRLT
jgi:hypothetical protein